MRAPALLPALGLILLALPLGAETAMTAAEFDARTLGRTITYSQSGVIYGVEQYLPGRQVRWAFEGGECKTGHWFEQGGMICFTYDNQPELQCWTFHDQPEGLMARFWGAPDDTPLISLEESADPLACAGPDIGV
ncbi:hypothetical protein CCR83_09980 [Rhodobacter veldkampii DSM 11550]|uniref:Dihydrodipicolinate reductase n=1 Tax=Phaeovulum veldkampii DSM 11550 TaxID=1185920 RepID=A0A2T4JKJ1_9RHOB|nr:hypothetical protein [Phaeovulum veldkampii]MBK5946752.1 hypothetical protein [Phaeovulum veldkampii DSM 11550]PTE18415.1 hypothetical protein C5F46_04465 [Phaeovulum veldkampii DSM 11550]TDQ59293.1 hypothetical protein EV658_10861 [Phaeovulum veldkampii DSM 11550]